MRIVRINLLPATHRPARPLGISQYLVAAGVFAAVFSGTVYYTGLARLRDAALADTTAQELRLAQVRAGLEEAESLTQREAAVAAAEQELDGLEGRPWSPLLLAMADLTPAGMSWEVVSAAPDEVQVKGAVGSLADLAQFVTGLSASGHAHRIDVHDYAEPPVSGRFRFHLTMRLGEEGQDAGQPE